MFLSCISCLNLSDLAMSEALNDVHSFCHLAAEGQKGGGLKIIELNED